MRLNRLFKFAAALALSAVAAVSQAAIPGPATIYVDAAPNKYGSPNYAGWEASAFAQAQAGTFVNMANSFDPGNIGTKNFDVRDATVYSFGDLGKRLSFVYFIEGVTVADLQGHLQASLTYDWAGVTYDGYNEYYGATWQEPLSLVDVAGGVIGVAGWAYWGAYNTSTPAELAADLAAWAPEIGDINFSLRYVYDTAITSAGSLLAEANAVPEPGSLALLGLGLAGLAAIRRRRA